MKRWRHALVATLAVVVVFGGVVTAFPPLQSAARGRGAPAHSAQPRHPKPHLPTSIAPDWSNPPKSSGSGTPIGGSNPVNPSLLLWHGGPVQRQPQAYVIFWGPSWASGSGSSADWQIVENYFQDVGGTPFEDILTQYYDGTGSISSALQFGGAWKDTSAPPTDFSCLAPTIEDAAIQSEVVKAITTNNWPENGNVTYFVYTPSGDLVNSKSIGGACSGYLTTNDDHICGYHFYLSSIGVAYADIAYPGQSSPCYHAQSPNGNAYGDSLVNTTSHEQFEAITDPQLLLVNGKVTANGWYDANTQEIGDKCQAAFPATYTQLANGGTFNVQDEYVNAFGACANEYAPPSVYVTSSNGLYAFDPTSGAWLWRYLAPCTLTSPVVAGGLIIVGACSTLYALDAASTTLVWSYQLGGGLDGAPVVSNGTVYASAGGVNAVYALSASTGALLWQSPVSVGGAPSQPVLGNGAVFVTAGGLLLALNAGTGAQLWQHIFSGYLLSGLAYGASTVYFWAYNLNCTQAPCYGLNAYDAASGLFVWGGVYTNISAPPVVANGVLYEPDYQLLNAFDASLGTTLWSVSVSATASIQEPPAIANGIAYLSMSDGSIIAFNTSNQTKVWQVSASSSLPSLAILGDGALFAAGGGASVYALDPATGNQLWRSPLPANTQNMPTLG
jgi:outer membrane protein assembly factor BamB